MIARIPRDGGRAERYWIEKGVFETSRLARPLDAITVPLTLRVNVRRFGTVMPGNIDNTTQSSVMAKPEAAATLKLTEGAGWPRIGIANIIG